MCILCCFDSMCFLSIYARSLMVVGLPSTLPVAMAIESSWMTSSRNTELIPCSTRMWEVMHNKVPLSSTLCFPSLSLPSSRSLQLTLLSSFFHSPPTSPTSPHLPLTTSPYLTWFYLCPHYMCLFPSLSTNLCIATSSSGRWPWPWTGCSWRAHRHCGGHGETVPSRNLLQTAGERTMSLFSIYTILYADTIISWCASNQ